MHAKPTTQHWNTFADEVVNTLPDDLHLRKTMLVVLLASLPRDFERRHQIAKMLEHLRAHDAAQLKFSQMIRR